MVHDCTGHMWKIRWHRKPDGSFVYFNDYCYPGRLSYEEEIRKAARQINRPISRTVFVTKFYEPRRNPTQTGPGRNPFQRA
jgi:hypothetical protein